MMVAVVADDVSFVVDPADDLRESLRIEADDEEGRLDAEFAECIENGGRRLIARTVVERQGVARGTAGVAAVDDASPEVRARLTLRMRSPECPLPSASRRLFSHRQPGFFRRVIY
jgi:hypothetical protein